MRRKYDDISNSDLAKIIDDWVKGEKYRALMKRRLIDKASLEQPTMMAVYEYLHGKHIDKANSIEVYQKMYAER